MVRYQTELQTALRVAQEAGEAALRFQAQGVQAEQKPDLSPVTIADRECEAIIVQRLMREFPEDGLLGEEGAKQQTRSGRRWIIDPIDGTRDFVRGNPRWAILLALEVEGQVQLGVAHFPALRNTYTAVRGEGAYMDGARIHCSSVNQLSEAVACINGFIKMHTMPFRDQLLDWMGQCFAVRSYGGGPDALSVARGESDIYLEPGCQPWDLAPLQVILQEAGVRVFNFKGTDSIYEGNCVACTPGLEQEMRALVGAPPAG